MTVPGNHEVQKKLREIFAILKETCGDNEQSTLRDLLTDIRHFSDIHDLDFHKALDGSYEVYLEEKEEL